MTLWDRGAFEAVFPPFHEGTVGAYVETLFRGRCFSKGIADIGPKDEKVFGGGDGVEEPRACLIDAVSVDFVKYLDGT